MVRAAVIAIAALIFLLASPVAAQRVPAVPPPSSCPEGQLVPNPYPPELRRLDVYWSPGSNCQQVWIVLSVQADGQRYRVYRDGVQVAETVNEAYPNLHLPLYPLPAGVGSALQLTYTLRVVNTDGSETTLDGPASLPAYHQALALMLR
jgi:hypothetical protein